MKIIQQTTHNILSPLGFKQQKLVWRRKLSDMHQVIGYDKMTVMNGYNLIYGLNISKFSENPQPPLVGLHVEWALTMKFPLEMRRIITDVLNMENDIVDAVRVTTVDTCIRKYILPTFDGTDSLEKLREVLSQEPAHPLSTLFFRFRLDDL